MGWFEDQIKQRREQDDQMLEDSFIRISGVVMGHKSAEQTFDEQVITKTAIDEIMKYFHYKPVTIPEDVTGYEEQLDYCLRPHGVMRRIAKLSKGWYDCAFTPMLARKKDTGTWVALIPIKAKGYWYRDEKTGKRALVTKKAAEQFDENAICFYRALPQTSLKLRDLIHFMRQSIFTHDILWVIMATLMVTLVGMLTPRVTKALTGPILTSGNSTILISVLICLICFAMSSGFFSIIKGTLVKRVESKASLSVSAALIMRMISLPTRFFQKYPAGELKSRIMSANQLCSLIINLVMTVGFSTISSLMYIKQIFNFTPELALPAILTILATVLFSSYITLRQIKISKRQMEFSAKESGMSYAMITGVQKIRLSGAEKRIYSRWLDAYSDSSELTYNPPMLLKISGVITTAISLFSTIIMYDLAVRSGIDTSSYFAFTSAYGMVMGAFTTLSGTVTSAARIKPILDLAEPFLKEVPETAEGKELVTRLAGRIELNHVSFRYDPNTPYILQDLSLQIAAGEYVAIVGRTGCGKSTLIRLLLGFEKPEIGSVFFDGKDLNNVDLSSLRRKIGTVLQSDGLFQGDIYSNIVITAPELTMEDAWKAAETAGIAQDIREMPMGMATIISEGHGGISGGQRQRLMIARAIAPNPRVLIFDEATSALDNKTQKQVSEALDGMGCTRIVIAHRLSTIRHCDRILVLDGGHIVEDGTYDELIEKGGYFAELVERQRLDTDEAAKA